MAVNDKEVMFHATGGRTPCKPRSTADGRELDHWAIPPINKLPSELLADIMGIVASSAPCWINCSSTNDPVVRYPDVLAHVCSHWRQVAVESRSLWSHIDLKIWNTSAASSRAITFLDRAGQSPLHLHIAGRHYTHSKVELSPFLAPIASQLKSLELFVNSEDLSEAQTSILRICLASCTVGNLTELDIRFTDQYYLHEPFFIGACGDSNESTGLLDLINHQEEWVYINVPQEHLEDLLTGVNVLRLSLIYPPWTSSAYHGLVELRLLGGAMCQTSIAESQLVNMLRYSPRLRILHFDLIIVDFVSLDTTIDDPVVLKDLEVLNLDWMREDGIEIFLRWLTPSPTLSQFSYFPFNSAGFDHPAIVAFLANSNITMTHINATYTSFKRVVGLLSLCHHTQVLALNNILLGDTEGISLTELHTLYLLESTLKVNHLRRWIESSSIQRLILYKSDLNGDGSELDPNQAPALLSDICPEVVVVPDESPNPMEGWEVFWDIDD